MNIATQGVSLAKASDLTAGLSVDAQLQNLQERVWMLARELDAVNAELAVRRDIELELVRFSFETAVENEVLRDTVEVLSVSLGLELGLTLHA
ncbi:hypothetical protein BLA24_25830 [Streptomyces cinnamoneus]|uniref:Uncharacterized protein n=1 Tax=Streptomyces cinnamoneus TaxID=53446 RepID=A0A2G1XE02_STRCJ|nr:hypothetical protein [Streptomyces cinnamoneus]PHQ49463.1 hypothetical protein BLA24_25830 [Streptomyces cinnamoneus]PPT14887.1 hypothetical protein CYQ11_20240 [Streptomyces cinnamoneus]